MKQSDLGKSLDPSRQQEKFWSENSEKFTAKREKQLNNI
jgi:hypothetical protein